MDCRLLSKVGLRIRVHFLFGRSMLTFIGTRTRLERIDAAILEAHGRMHSSRKGHQASSAFSSMYRYGNVELIA